MLPVRYPIINGTRPCAHHSLNTPMGLSSWDHHSGTLLSGPGEACFALKMEAAWDTGELIPTAQGLHLREPPSSFLNFLALARTLLAPKDF